MNDNPYASPKSKVLDSNPTASDEVRRAHLNFEANVKALGILYYINSAIALMAGLSVGLAPSPDDIALSEETGISTIVLALIGSVFAVGLFFLGRGLRGFKSWARIIAIILSVIGLLAFPFGTIISGFILFFLSSKKGGYVFTPEYQTLISDTPHIKYKTSVIVWIAVGLLLLLLVVPFLIAPFIALFNN